MKKISFLASAMLFLAYACVDSELEPERNDGSHWSSGGNPGSQVKPGTDVPGEDGIVIKDEAFQDFCIENFDTNGDGIIQKEEAEAVTSFDCGGENISDVSGIESFENLESLVCDRNRFSCIDISRLKHLEYLSCMDNPELKTVWVWNGIDIEKVRIDKPADSEFAILVKENSMEVPDAGGSFRIHIRKDVKEIAPEGQYDWLRFTELPASGRGACSVWTMDVDENTAGGRVAVFYLAAEDGTVEMMEVVQSDEAEEFSYDTRLSRIGSRIFVYGITEEDLPLFPEEGAGGNDPEDGPGGGEETGGDEPGSGGVTYFPRFDYEFTEVKDAVPNYSEYQFPVSVSKKGRPYRWELVCDWDWIRFTPSSGYGSTMVTMQVNGNPSTLGRSARVWLNVIAADGGSAGHKMFFAGQNGVTFEMLTESNASDYGFSPEDFGTEPDNLLLLFPPYPSSVPFEFYTDADAVQYEMVEASSPDTYPDSTLPELRTENSGGNVRAVLSYPSNRKYDPDLSTARGSVTMIYPLIRVFDLETGSFEECAVTDSDGNLFLRAVTAIQNGIDIWAEEDTYLAYPVGGDDSRYPGYSRAEGYYGSEDVTVHSNVSWYLEDFGESSQDDWEYMLSGDPVLAYADGFNDEEVTFDLYVNDRAAEFYSDIYQMDIVYPDPDEVCNARRTQIHVMADLHDGLAPVEVPIISLYQFGIPYMTLDSYTHGHFTEGVPSGVSSIYSWTLELDINYTLHSDDLTNDVCEQYDLAYYTIDDAAQIKYGGRFDWPLGRVAFYTTYPVLDIYADALIMMGNGVYVKSVEPIHIDYDESYLDESAGVSSLEAPYPAMVSRTPAQKTSSMSGRISLDDIPKMRHSGKQIRFN